MTENLKAFNQALSADEELRGEFEQLLENLRASRAEAIIGFAESHGYALTAEDFAPAPVEGEISEEELDVVTGGFNGYNPCPFGGTEDEQPIWMWY